MDMMSFYSDPKYPLSFYSDPKYLPNTCSDPKYPEPGPLPYPAPLFSVMVCQLVYSIRPCSEFSQPRPDCL
jgi:hypothetical protein